MSSILKALQKLESETLEKGTGQPWLHKFNTGKKSPGKQGRIRGKYRFALLGIVLTISGGVAFFFLQNEPVSLTSISGSPPVPGTGNLMTTNQPGHPEPGMVKPVGAARRETITDKAGTPPESTITREDDATIRSAALDGVDESGAPERTPAGGPAVSSHRKQSENTYPAKPSGPEAGLVKAVSPAGQKKSAPLPESLETPQASRQPGAMENPDTAMNANQAESARNTGREAVDERQQQSFVKRIQTPDINLHAISWTPDVKTRIAVINGSIVREGDTVLRYRVSKINKDDIILSEGGELWRLAFSGRQ